MKNPLLLALLALPAATQASERGEQLYDEGCASCHAAQPPETYKPRAVDPEKPGRAQGPNLGQVVRTRNAAWLRAWVASPDKVRPGTGCDTRIVQPEEVDMLLSYLVTASLPPLAPTPDLLRREVDEGLAEKRQERSHRVRAEDKR